MVASGRVNIWLILGAMTAAAWSSTSAGTNSAAGAG
jgi:hypothetical protein